MTSPSSSNRFEVIAFINIEIHVSYVLTGYIPILILVSSLAAAAEYFLKLPTVK